MKVLILRKTQDLMIERLDIIGNLSQLNVQKTHIINKRVADIPETCMKHFVITLKIEMKVTTPGFIDWIRNFKKNKINQYLSSYLLTKKEKKSIVPNS